MGNFVGISKLGNYHLESNINNQDYAFVIPGAKFVLDGCGSGKHSEVGVRLFSQLMIKEARKEKITYINFQEKVNKVIKQMLLIEDSDEFICENFCFTILACFETSSDYIVMTCGDGYIIEQKSGIEDVEVEKIVPVKKKKKVLKKKDKANSDLISENTEDLNKEKNDDLKLKQNGTENSKKQFTTIDLFTTARDICNFINSSKNKGNDNKKQSPVENMDASSTKSVEQTQQKEEIKPINDLEPIEEIDEYEEIEVTEMETIIETIKKKVTRVSFKKLDDGEYPKYYIYNFIKDKSSMLEYKDGVDFECFRYSKREYEKIGIASDGLRYYQDLSDEECENLRQLLINGESIKVKLLINRNQSCFKDDISVVF